MKNTEKPHLVKCILQVSPTKTQFTEKIRLITEESNEKVHFSISDPTELKNFDAVSVDKIGKVSEIIHHLSDSLFVCIGYCRPGGVEAVKLVMWDAITKAAIKSHTEASDRATRIQSVILRMPHKSMNC